MRFATVVRQAVCAVLCSVTLFAQNSAEKRVSPQATPTTIQNAQQQAAQGADDLTQMQNDLNKMESLNMNMSSEIEFLHDQNLQILLRTNSQMWTILIGDLRRQIVAEQQPKTRAPAR